MKTFKATILLGTNLGNKKGNIHIAKGFILAICGKITNASSIYESEAWGKEDQDSFYNQVIVLKTPYPPNYLMNLLLNIELKMGRKRKEKWGPRLIDLDLLFYEKEILTSKKLTLPHPGIQDRIFTLLPLNEINPTFIHPELDKTMKELLQDCKDPLTAHKI